MNSQKVRVIKLAAMVACLAVTLGYVALRQPSYARPLAQTKNPLQPTEKNIALGLDHFDAHCASCHGSSGKADSEKGKTVHAADLTSEKIQSKSDSELFRIISRGVRGTAMPAFARSHSPTEIWQAVLFLRK